MSLFLNRNHYVRDYELSFKDKLLNMSWSFFVLLMMASGIGLVLLYSITGGFTSWTERQAMHFVVGYFVFFVIVYVHEVVW